MLWLFGDCLVVVVVALKILQHLGVGARPKAPKASRGTRCPCATRFHFCREADEEEYIYLYLLYTMPEEPSLVVFG